MGTSGRLAGEELLDHVRENAKSVLGPGFWELRIGVRVEAGWKPERLEPRLLLVSKFRVFLVSGKVGGKSGRPSATVEHSWHLLQLRSLEEVGDRGLRLGLEDGRRLELRLLVAEPRTLALALLAALRHYFPSSSDFLSRLWDVSSPELLKAWAALPEPLPPLPCFHFRRTYAALCDAHKLPFRDEVAWDVDKIYAAHETRVLRLSDFSHLFQKDLVPIIGVVEMSPWFTGVLVESYKLSSEIQDALEAVARRSLWLKSLVIRNSGLRGEFLSRLGTALKDNGCLKLEELELSGNLMEDGKTGAGVGTALAAGLAVAGTSLKRLSLAESGLSAKALQPVLGALYRAQLSSATLTTLQLQHNPINDPADLLNLIAHSTQLSHLDISHTGLSLEKGFWSKMVMGGLKLERLRVAGCALGSRKKSERDTPPAGMKEYLASVVGLVELDASEAVTSAEVLKALLLGLASNSALSRLQLNLSGLQCEKGLGAVLETSLPGIRGLRGLGMRELGLEAELGPVLAALARCPSLRRLSLGGNNFHSLRKQQGKALPAILYQLVGLLNKDDGGLEELDLSDAKLGVQASVVLNALGPSPSLHSLDLSGNDVGNFGARLFAKALQINSKLSHANMDRNRIGLEGFVDIGSALVLNETLSSFPFPLVDVGEAGRTERSEKLQTALRAIQDAVLRNARRQTPRQAPLADSLKPLLDSLSRKLTAAALPSAPLRQRANALKHCLHSAPTLLQQPVDPAAKDTLRRLLSDSLGKVQSGLSDQIDSHQSSEWAAKKDELCDAEAHRLVEALKESSDRSGRELLKWILEKEARDVGKELGSPASPSSRRLVPIPDSALNAPSTPPTPSRTNSLPHARPVSLHNTVPQDISLDTSISSELEASITSPPLSPFPVSAAPSQLTNALKSRPKPGPRRRPPTKAPAQGQTSSVARGLESFFQPGSEQNGEAAAGGKAKPETMAAEAAPVSSPREPPPLPEKPGKKPLLPPLPAKPTPVLPVPPPPPSQPPPPIPTQEELQALTGQLPHVPLPAPAAPVAFRHSKAQDPAGPKPAPPAHRNSNGESEQPSEQAQSAEDRKSVGDLLSVFESRGHSNGSHE